VAGAVLPGGAWLAAGLALGIAFGGRLRPVAKGVVKAGMNLAERVQGAGAEAVEQAQDLVAEVRHEREEERAAPAGERRARAPRTPSPGASN
jgi:hypothetical protein